ncbi:hypothetical protein C1H46_020782 [Malus baccata]|uniref:Uncharacterized protein n=1 Tax=Malus baccata TaxID=106549 RepID=A0A540M4F2_MALBA|nr:hypothetical protein C1H46_020782 [Malus baccata]
MTSELERKTILSAKGSFDLKRRRGGGGAFEGEVEELGVVQSVQVPGVENGGAGLEGVGGDVDGGHATTDDGVALEDPVKLRI